ncbi:hypothetical protein RQM59_02255 [Flavobacteriaceae bacterium S356]|uniref:Adhesin domain-containing protein n=1 Tax=Asprobacillus argus TaxID=3076534 RepID=A0ABU3LD09_9FLAO|nr:hypothetical protein [Flavobacteriaceae bacterium S356]
MKRYILFIGLLLTFSNLTAQKKVTENQNSRGINDVYVHVKFADNIEVKNWNKNEISVQATVNINDNEHNDYFSLKTNKIGDSYTVKSDYGDFFKKYRNYSRNSDDGDCNCYNQNTMEISYVIYVPKNMELKVKSISGSVVADAYVGALNLDLISGDITVKRHSENMFLKTISGDIDVVISDATFEAKTLTGGVYSDLDIDFTSNKKNKYSGQQKVRGKIRNGSASLELKTISGDIFLRKS